MATLTPETQLPETQLLSAQRREVDQPRRGGKTSERQYSATITAKLKGAPAAEQEWIVTRLWSRFELPLATAHLAEEFVQIYNGDRQQLAGWRSDIQRLLDAIGAVNFEFRVEGGRPERADDITRLLAERSQTAHEKFLFPKPVPDKTLFVTLLLQPPEDVHRALMQELQTQLSIFVTDIFATLDRLVAVDALGTIEWVSESLCKFNFLRDLVIHEPAADRIEEVREKVKLGDSDWLSTKANSFRVESVINRHRVELHEHELMNAVRESLDKATVVIPREIQPVLEAIPEWLKSMSEIVSGTCVRTRQAQIAVKDEEWQTREFIGSRIVTESISTDVYFDPAVTLGNYVLAGWSDMDIHREEQLRFREWEALRADALLARRKQETWAAGITGGAFMAGATITAFFAAVSNPWMYLASGTLGLLGLSCLGYGLFQWQLSRGVKANLKQTSTILAIEGGLTLAVAACGVALLAPSPAAWVIAAAGFGLAIVAWRSVETPF